MIYNVIIDMKYIDKVHPGWADEYIISRDSSDGACWSLIVKDRLTGIIHHTYPFLESKFIHEYGIKVRIVNIGYPDSADSSWHKFKIISITEDDYIKLCMNIGEGLYISDAH